jgi:hypothetical protein
MTRKASLVAAAAGGGMLAAALLPAVTAFAQGDGTAADISANAFTVDGLTFDPGSDGYTAVSPVFENAPLLATGGLTFIGIPLATQSLEVYDSSGNEVGTVTTGVNDANLLGFIDSAQFTITADTASDSYDGSAELPAVGTVYSITNFGGGYANVYQAVPNDDGTAAASISDTFVTPYGNFDVPTDYDAVANLDPTESFAGLDNPSQYVASLFGGSATSAADGGDIPGSDNAFTLGGVTYDPGANGWGAVDYVTDEFVHGFDPATGTAPLLEITPGLVTLPGGGSLTLASQNFDIYGDEGNVIGTAETGVNAGNILGLIETGQFTVTDVTPAEGVDADAAGLPVIGTVYSVTDFGNGYENVYGAVPGSGDSATTITDTLVTPFGNFDVPTDFDATAPLDPGDATEGLNFTSGSGAAGDVGSDNAFTIGDSTFDPGADGWTGVAPLFGASPLLELGGGTVLGAVDLATQDLEVYNASGVEVGTVDTAVNTSDIFGIDTTQFTITDVTAADGKTGADALPVEGTVYSVTNLGMGTYNVYEAIPGTDGADPTITDTLVTSFGNFDLSTMFNALADLDPGDAVAGVSDAGGDLFSGLF